MNKISVIVITKDEEKNISDCLKSVEWTDEIIVVDAESTDNTVDHAKKFTDKVFIKKWEGYVPQKKYALSLASNKWTLSLDADERITPELKTEILNLSLDDISGYKIRRRNFLLNKEITSCGWGNDYQLRLFEKEKTNMTDRLVHEGFTADGKVRKLKNPMLHYTFSHTFSAFFVFFFTKRGFKDGVYGLIISLLHSVSTMLNYIKLWELQNKK